MFDYAASTIITGGVFNAFEGNPGMRSGLLGSIHGAHLNHESHYGTHESHSGPHERDYGKCVMLWNIETLSPQLITS